MTTVASSMLLDGPAKLATLAINGTLAPSPAKATAAAAPSARSLSLRAPAGLRCQHFGVQLQGQEVVRSRRTWRQAKLELETDAVSEEEGVSFAALQRMLEAGEWEAADAETRRLLIELAGEGAVKRNWVYFSEVKFISEQALRTLDGLWRQHSNGKFGYSVQRRIWNNVDKSCTKFFIKVAWTRPLNDKVQAYKKFPMEFTWDNSDAAPEGHLPLTNCLRGTLLLKELLEHPAFAQADQEEAELLPSSTSDLQSLMGASSLKGLF